MMTDRIRMVGLSATTRSILRVAIQDIIAGDSVDVRLFKNDIEPGPNVTAADFVQSDFIGYLALAGLTLQVNARQPGTNTVGLVMNDLGLFKTSNVVTPQTAYGYYVVNHASGVLLWWGRFDTPVVFAITQDFVAFPIEVWLPANF